MDKKSVKYPVSCNVCKRTGRVHAGVCPNCHGYGVVKPNIQPGETKK